ncbi:MULTISPECIES: thioredoxin family protein [Marinobacter]|uniref:Small redox-active disulfide protein 2 n=1 Tax=Marinobacter segnicrescens TaxID=430453 RepID=A0A1I0FIP7_9GAMM|nr:MULTISPECIES: thioredoxin family protein [Marinobacter]UZD65451.1 thioredoxin family protein [Marinobacter sp. AN1]SET58138.1 small redox-active disulfide protein 2 [Marinobacter segnicrescens]
MKRFEVLGTGCKKCVTTAESIERVAQELGESIEVVKVTDPAKIMEYQVMSTPAVAVDGTVVHSGSIPDHAKIVSWLKA